MLSRHPRERDPSVVELMDAVGDHLGELLHASAQATEREQLVEELLEARRRNEFLLLATQVLSEVVDYREMVERLAQVSVPVMADVCLIDIEDEDGQMRRMAAWHADPDKRALTEELRTSYPPDPEGDASGHGGHAQRPVDVERGHDRRVPPRDEPGTSATTTSSRRSGSPPT